MSIVRAFSLAVRRSVSERSMIFILYIITLLTALPLALAWKGVLGSGFGASMAPSQLMRGMDFTVLQDFMNVHQFEVATVFRQLSWAVLVFMLVNTFLAGGIVGSLREAKGSFSAASFFGGCGRYFFRFFRLFLLFAVVLLLLVFVFGGIIGAMSEALTANSTSEITDLWINIVAMAIFVFPIMILIMIADYAKISVVMTDDRSMLKTAWGATKFVFRRLAKTLGLELAMFLVPIVLFALYVWIDLTVGMTSSLTIILMFVVQQLFIILRAWTKIFFYAGELTLFENLQPIVPPAVPAPVAAPAAGAAGV